MRKLHYDLKKPCADCPFLKATPLHEGICDNLSDYLHTIKEGHFSHSCHKTDSLSDSEEGKRYTGNLQHCAGALAMIAQGKLQDQYVILSAVQRGEADLGPLRKVKGVYRSLKELFLTYYAWVDEHQPAGKTGMDYLQAQKRR